ncbi:Protein of unknown function [Sphingomonas guangdongensis]|uniref:DUF4238 domain-containing protein n=1 Tax=Sphingomonas guangdongensis TaxID=1141890 RepID=A0A285QZ37_9SPHN|nr:DUF4238 domain-containing protein [Sphingomonas guangdongensis]SOB87173.1 Protein of unknown function [Sphingomonas guangdongensis]
MNSSNPPVKHHYIPKFLLAQWALNEGKLWRYLQPIPGKMVTKPVAPAEIGYEEHLYATPGLPPEQTQQIEQLFMSPLDSLAADAHQLLLAGKVQNMPQRERSAWSRFIMSQWFRTPDSLRYFKEAMRLALTVRDDALNARYAELKQEGYPESLEAIVEMMGPEFVEQTAMGLLRKMSDDPKNGLRLNNMVWAVIETSGGREFLISDAALHQGNSGIFSAQGYATLPIAPRKLFVAASSPTTVQQIRALARNDLVSRNNRAVVRRASIFVGATDLSQTPWIEKNFGQEENDTLIKGLVEKYRTTFAETGASA